MTIENDFLAKLAEAVGDPQPDPPGTITGQDIYDHGIPEWGWGIRWVDTDWVECRDHAERINTDALHFTAEILISPSPCDMCAGLAKHDAT